MPRIRFAIGLLFALWTLQATAQTSTNPFELKWKTGEAPPPAETSAPVTIEDVTVATPEPEIDTTADMAISNDPGGVDSSQMPVGLLPLESEAFDLSIEPPVVEETADDNAVGDDEVIPAEKEVIEEAEPPVEMPKEKEAIHGPVLPGPSRNVGVFLIVAMLGLSILVLTWAVNANRGFINKIYRAAMNENLSALLLREQRFASLQYLYYIVYATFFINASLFFFLISRYSNWTVGDGRTPLILFLGVIVGIYLTRHFAMRFIGSTFAIDSETTHYSFNVLLFNILAGVALIPINLVLAFGPEAIRMPVIYGGLGLLGLLYLLRQLRGLNIASHIISGNVFQFFVYLCAVEILPVLVLYKYFITH